MFSSKRQSTIIAEGLKIVGTITAEGLVEVNGQVDGEMHCTSLVVSRSAQIAGTITADHVVIDGRVEGPIRCGEVILKSAAHVLGDIQCQSLVVEKGAVMEGRLMRGGRGGSRSDSLLTDMTRPIGAGDDGQAEAGVSARHVAADETVAFNPKRGKARTKPLVDGDGSGDERYTGAPEI